MSKIEWTHKTWNPVTGCKRVSAGCDNCYAVSMTRRLARIGATRERYAGLVNEGKRHFNGLARLHGDELARPLSWKKPRRVFVCSMSDLFYDDVPDMFIVRVFAVMAICGQHTFQVLTKRPDRMARFLNKPEIRSEISAHVAIHIGRGVGTDPRTDEVLPWPLPNVWIGTSVEKQTASMLRVPYLLKAPAAVRFLSCEPLLGQVNFLQDVFAAQATIKTLSLMPEYVSGHGVPTHAVYNTFPSKIDWVIVGGESGKNARPMHPAWVRLVRDQCTGARIPFFFKQWGEWSEGSDYNKKGLQHAVVLNNGDTIPDHDFEVIKKYSISLKSLEPVVMARRGKKAGGRLFDGLEYNEYPGREA